LEDVTQEAGTTFSHTSSRDKEYIFESMTGGVIIFDYDRGGWPDIYFTNAPAIKMALDGQAATRSSFATAAIRQIGSGPLTIRRPIST